MIHGRIVRKIHNEPSHLYFIFLHIVTLRYVTLRVIVTRNSLFFFRSSFFLFVAYSTSRRYWSLSSDKFLGRNDEEDAKSNGDSLNFRGENHRREVNFSSKRKRYQSSVVSCLISDLASSFHRWFRDRRRYIYRAFLSRASYPTVRLSSL